MTPLTPKEVRDFLSRATFHGAERSAPQRWAQAGITCTLSDGQLQLTHDRKVIGMVQPSTEFPGYGLYHAVLPQPGGLPRNVPYPAGFLPADPLRAYNIERKRWNAARPSAHR